jgi:hypothetical protein
MTNEARAILDEIEATLAFQLTIANLYTLDECRISTPRAREIVARIKSYKNKLAKPERAMQSSTIDRHLDKMFGLN